MGEDLQATTVDFGDIEISYSQRSVANGSGGSSQSAVPISSSAGTAAASFSVPQQPSGGSSQTTSPGASAPTASAQCRSFDIGELDAETPDFADTKSYLVSKHPRSSHLEGVWCGPPCSSCSGASLRKVSSVKEARELSQAV
jgi:hypothetical protein